ncbi:MAG: type II CAAX prenyl endopeptidase Rce1 family protein, partial [Acidobacteriota bacterium]
MTGGHYPGLPLSLSAPHEYVLAMLAGAVAAPICEEAVFRGFLLGSLRRHGVHLAVWVSAACFGIFHLDPIRFIPTMALGVVYGYLTLSTGSIRPSMVAHGVNNGMALSLAYMAGPEGRSGADLTYPAIKEEILRNISAAHLSLGVPAEELGEPI